MDGLTPEQLKELARLHKEREALAEKTRNLDMIISDMLGISPTKATKKIMSSKDFLAACSA